MIAILIKPIGQRITLAPVVFTRDQMAYLGNVGLTSIKKRVSRGIGSSDVSMPPLQVGYQRLKARRANSSIRDLSFTGAMLNDFSVRSVNDSSVRLDITTSLSRIKAKANEDRSPWINFSPSDEAVIFGEAYRIFQRNISGVLIRAAGSRSAALINPFAFRRSLVGRAA